ncbi:hypothetical protein JTE90_007648 [Oedothorax gibbosus]|uniref:Uncharacterized protein n=1 Tax=Oedothorax gibbosus TaxID=931172 RepID=A0AAV6UJC4_9ARAC|nr:hypothetical protein JTE90_007648 [Oedothorax gibbosus]
MNYVASWKFRSNCEIHGCQIGRRASGGELIMQMGLHRRGGLQRIHLSREAADTVPLEQTCVLASAKALSIFGRAITNVNLLSEL